MYNSNMKIHIDFCKNREKSSELIFLKFKTKTGHNNNNVVWFKIEIYDNALYRLNID